MTSRPKGAAANTATAEPNAAPVGTARPKRLPKELLLPLVHRMRAATGLSQGELAARVATKREQIRNHEHPHLPHLPTLAQLAHPDAPDSYVDEAMRGIAVMRGGDRMWLETPADVHGDNDAARLSGLSVELTDVLRVVAVDLADGKADDLRAWLKEAIEARAVLDELIASAQKRLGEGKG